MSDFTHEECQALYALGYPSLGYPGGSFVSALLEAIIRADNRNQIKLATVFPEYVNPIRNYQRGQAGFKARIDAALSQRGGPCERR